MVRSPLTLLVVVALGAACGGPGIVFDEPNATPRASQDATPAAPAPAPAPQPASDPGDDAKGGAGDGAGEAPELPSDPPPPTLPPIPPGPPVELGRTRSLFWSWPCAGETARAAPSDPASLAIEGSGEFVVELGARDTLALEIAGRYCRPDAAPRDVLLVVDTSSSMRDILNGGHDPLKSGTCERVKAVEAVLATLGADARVSLITFSDEVKADGGPFVAPAELKAKLVKPGTLCDRGTGTNYKRALARAEEIVMTARPHAATEVYFLSDGQPSSASVDGMEEAARIRLRATIATLIVRGEDDVDTVLQDGIASRGLDGQPLHAAIGSASEMAASLARLAHAPLAEVVVTVGGERTTFDPATGDEFRLSNLQFARGAFPDGLSLTVELRDVRGRLTGGRGMLKAK